MKKIVVLQLSDFLSQYCTINAIPFCFRSGVSTGTDVNIFLNLVYDGFGNIDFNMCVLLDLKKALGTVKRRKETNFYKKIIFDDMRHDTFSWFQNYFSRRQRFAYLNRAKYTLMNFDCGAVQGRVICPIMCILYTNDIENHRTCLI